MMNKYSSHFGFVGKQHWLSNGEQWEISFIFEHGHSQSSPCTCVVSTNISMLKNNTTMVNIINIQVQRVFKNCSYTIQISPVLSTSPKKKALTCLNAHIITPFSPSLSLSLYIYIYIYLSLSLSLSLSPFKDDVLHEPKSAYMQTNVCIYIYM